MTSILLPYLMTLSDPALTVVLLLGFFILWTGSWWLLHLIFSRIFPPLPANILVLHCPSCRLRAAVQNWEALWELERIPGRAYRPRLTARAQNLACSRCDQPLTFALVQHPRMQARKERLWAQATRELYAEAQRAAEDNARGPQ